MILAAVAVSLEGKKVQVPSNLLLVGGFAKCGTSHIHKVLASHPKVFALRKEIRPLSRNLTEAKLYEQVFGMRGFSRC